MRQFEWKKNDSFDWFLVCSQQEAQRILFKGYDLPDPGCYSEDDDYFFLVNEDRRIISCIPDLDYAFDFESEPPFGQEVRPRLPVDRMRIVPYEQVQLPNVSRMLGAAVGDLCGIRYKYARCRQLPQLEDLIDEAARFTDETVLFTAGAHGLARALKKKNPKERTALIRDSLRYFGDLYRHAGYDGDMLRWLSTYNARPLRKDTPAALLQALPSAWFARNMDEVMLFSDLCVSASCSSSATLQAARILSGSLYLMRRNHSRSRIEEFAGRFLDIPSSLEEAAALHSTSMDLAAQALWCVLNAKSYVEVMENAISLSGESDRLCALAGALAEGLFSIPLYLRRKACARLDSPIARSLKESADISLESSVVPVKRSEFVSLSLA